jgi:hypothetical protein
MICDTGVEKLNFIARFSKNTQISNFTKISSVGAKLFHSDGRTDGQSEYRETDMTKPMVTFCNFANAPKNCYIIFSASCNYLKIVIKGRLQCLIKIISFYYFVLITDLLHLVKIISNNVLPHGANVLRICITHSQVKSRGPKTILTTPAGRR